MRPRRRDEVRWLDYLGMPSLFAVQKRWRAFTEREGVRLAVRFLLAFAALQFLSSFLLLDRQAMQDAVAAAVAWSSRALGLSASRSGSLVTFDGSASYEVTFGCTGISVATMLLAAVVAYPASAQARALGALLSAPFVFAVNLLRLDTMGWLAARAPGWFALTHEVGWEAGVILAGAFGFLAWVRLVAQRDAPFHGRWEQALVSLAFFAGLTLVALGAGADAALGRLLVPALQPLGRTLWGAAFPPPGLSEGLDPQVFLVIFTGFAAVALASRRLPARRRLLVALGAAVPALLGALLHALVRSASLLGLMASDPLVYTLDALAFLGLPLAAWALWAIPSRRRV